jgi:CRISPR/Cas system-associated exonuclease Cas4 (RecB family)
VETELPIEFLSLQPAQMNVENERIVIEKDDNVMARLHEMYDVNNEKHRFLSPSAINSYLKCPLIFYFDQVAGIRPEQQLDEQVDAPTFGLIFHEAAQKIYESLTQNGPEIKASDIDHFIEDKNLEMNGILNDAFYRHYFSKISEIWKMHRPNPLPYTGLNLLVREVISTYLKQLLLHDKKLCPFSILALEEKNTRIVEVKTPSESFNVEIGGVIDRIDKVFYNGDDNGPCSSILRIVDYKTGGKPQSSESMENLFIPNKNRPGYLLQTFLYASTINAAMQQNSTSLPKAPSETQQKQTEQMPIAPALFFVSKSASEDYSPYVEFGSKKEKEKVLNFQQLEPEFLAHLQTLLSEIFDSSVPFGQTQIPESCAHCNYRLICKKHDKEKQW